MNLIGHVITSREARIFRGGDPDPPPSLSRSAHEYTTQILILKPPSSPYRLQAIEMPIL